MSFPSWIHASAAKIAHTRDTWSNNSLSFYLDEQSTLYHLLMTHILTLWHSLLLLSKYTISSIDDSHFDTVTLIVIVLLCLLFSFTAVAAITQTPAIMSDSSSAMFVSDTRKFASTCMIASGAKNWHQKAVPVFWCQFLAHVSSVQLANSTVRFVYCQIMCWFWNGGCYSQDRCVW